MLELILIFLSLVVATSALFIQRQHNRKQLLPLLYIRHSLKKSGNKNIIDISLVNDGQGPGEIISFELSVGEKKYNIKHQNDLTVALRENMPNVVDNDIGFFRFIKANSEATLISYTILDNDPNPFSSSSISLRVISLYKDVINVNEKEYIVQPNNGDKLFTLLVAFLDTCMTKIQNATSYVNKKIS